MHAKCADTEVMDQEGACDGTSTLPAYQGIPTQSCLLRDVIVQRLIRGGHNRAIIEAARENYDNA